MQTPAAESGEHEIIERGHVIFSKFDSQEFPVNKVARPSNSPYQNLRMNDPPAV
jgi:hypothetical protein